MSEDCREPMLFEMEDWIREEIDYFSFQEIKLMAGFYPEEMNDYGY